MEIERNRQDFITKSQTDINEFHNQVYSDNFKVSNGVKVIVYLSFFHIEKS